MTRTATERLPSRLAGIALAFVLAGPAGAAPADAMDVTSVPVAFQVTDTNGSAARCFSGRFPHGRRGGRRRARMRPVAPRFCATGREVGSSALLNTDNVNQELWRQAFWKITRSLCFWHMGPFCPVRRHVRVAATSAG